MTQTSTPNVDMSLRGAVRATNLRGHLGQIMAELERQKSTKLDFCADSRTMIVSPHERDIMLQPGDLQTGEWLPKEGLPFLMQALEQLGDRVSPDVPGRFLRKLAAERPEIASRMMHDLMHATGKRYFFRCLDGRVRAVLSSQFRALDHYDYIFEALPVIKENDGFVLEAMLNDRNMEIKFTSPRLSATAPNSKNGGSSEKFNKIALPSTFEVGKVYPFFGLSNSETGHGGLDIYAGIFEPRCKNGMMLETILNRVHLGEKLDKGVYTEETQAADTKAIMLKARDAIRSSLSGTMFNQMMENVNEAAVTPIKAPTGAVDNLVKNASLTDAAKDAILRHFLSDYDMTRYGLAGAVSRAAQDTESVEDAAALEDLSGKLIKDKKGVLIAA